MTKRLGTRCTNVKSRSSSFVMDTDVGSGLSPLSQTRSRMEQRGFAAKTVTAQSSCTASTLCTDLHRMLSTNRDKIRNTVRLECTFAGTPAERHGGHCARSSKTWDYYAKSKYGITREISSTDDCIGQTSDMTFGEALGILPTGNGRLL
jgi:hypothetical protein